jgi:ATP-dependent Clp protease ATP-binding subunit ClpC
MTIEILKGLREVYEEFHAVKITDQALIAAANLSDRYISDRFLPDKAIDLIDEAGSRLRIRRMDTPPAVKRFDEDIARVRSDKESAMESGALARTNLIRPPRRPAARPSTSWTKRRSPKCWPCGPVSRSTA